jgi:hypothetical protein
MILALQISATLVLLASRTAGAQIVATSLTELQDLVRAGETIHVTDASGRRTKGRLGTLSPTALELLVPKRAYDGSESLVPQARLGETDIRQALVERRDPPWRGTLIGLAAVGGPWAVICSRGCTYNEPGGENLIRVAALITSGIAAGIGTLVDAAMVKRTTVYYNEAPGRSPAAEVSPLLSRATAFADLRDRIKAGDTIYVTDTRGGTSKGKLVGLSASSLRVRVGGDASPSLDLSQGDVNNIVVERFDSVWNGMLVGFAAGAAPVALIGAGASASGGEVAGVAAGYGAIGLLIGLAVDAFNRDRATVYVGGAQQRSPRVGVITTPSGGAALQIAVEF